MFGPKSALGALFGTIYLGAGLHSGLHVLRGVVRLEGPEDPGGSPGGVWFGVIAWRDGHRDLETLQAAPLGGRDVEHAGELVRIDVHGEQALVAGCTPNGPPGVPPGGEPQGDAGP